MKVDIYGGRDPREEPAYTVRETAVYLGLPVSTVRVWTVGQPYRTHHGQKIARPLFEPAQCEPVTLSFWNLVEVYVLAGIRRHHGVPLQRVRKALDYVKRHLDLDRPLVQQQFLTDGVDLFIEHYARGLLNASAAGQMALRDLLIGTLRRIEGDPQGLADRVYPWMRTPDEPRAVEINPRLAFGRLVVAGTGIPTEAVAERFRAGESIESLANDYRLKRDQVEMVLRWEQCAATAH